MPNDLFSDDFIVDPNKDYWTEYTGPGGKFHSTNEAEAKQMISRAKAESDAYALRLEAEGAALREELGTRLKYEEFLEKLNTLPLSNQGNQPPVEPAADTSIKTEDIERLLEKKLNEKETLRIAEQNKNIVRDKLLEVYGPNYAQHLKRTANELGMSEQFVSNLAGANPKALLKLVGADQEKKTDLFNAPPRSSTTFTPSSSKGRGDVYYENIRKTDVNTYWTPKIQNEIFERIKEIGAEAYYSS